MKGKLSELAQLHQRLSSQHLLGNNHIAAKRTQSKQ
jgi:hypothetical protein